MTEAGYLRAIRGGRATKLSGGASVLARRFMILFKERLSRQVGIAPPDGAARGRWVGTARCAVRSQVSGRADGAARRPYHDALQRWLCGVLSVVLVQTAGAAEKTFTLSGVPVSLEDVSTEVGVRYKWLRLNRAANYWNFEITLE